MTDWKQYENESTLDLIQYIKWKNQSDYEDAAKAAFIAFCFRFRSDIIKKCEVICSKWHYDLDIAIELANRTFHKFWNNPNYNDNVRKTARTCDEGVKYYLYGIARNELTNLYRNENDPNPYEGNETIIWDFPDMNLEKIKPEKRKELEARREIIEIALSRLTAKHKAIYLTYLIHGRKGKNLPSHLLKQMREELELAQGTIRFYNHEAINTINDYLKIWDKANKK